MTLTSTNDSLSIFTNGKLKPGIYKVHNIRGQTYVDIREDSRELCCRPATALEGKGLVCLCPRLTLVVVFTITFSGKFSPPGLDTLYAGYSVESRLHLLCTF